MRVLEGHLEVAVRVGVIAERTAGEAKHAPGMARRKRNLEAVRSGVGKALDAIRPEVVVLALLTVRDHRRSRGLELRDRVANGRVIQRVQGRILRIGSDSLNQRPRSRDAANWLRRDVRHGSESGPIRRAGALSFTGLSRSNHLPAGGGKTRAPKTIPVDAPPETPAS